MRPALGAPTRSRTKDRKEGYAEATWRTVALHVFGLCGFATAQPVLDLLGNNPTFFVAHGSGPAHIFGLSLALVLLPPAAVVTGIWLTSRLWPAARTHLLPLVVGGLIAMALVPPLLRNTDLRALVWAAAFTVVAVGAAAAYRASGLLRQVVGLAAVAPVVFLGAFLFTPGIRVLAFPPPLEAAAVHPTSPKPVVVVVFDELPLLSLLNSDGNVNANRFPNFARLADTSTWYRNATTNSDGTRLAVPALLSGTIPRHEKSPTVNEYPNNLFTVLADDYRFEVSEFGTRLCPPAQCREHARADMKELLDDVGIVYLHLVLPPSISERFLPSLGARWAGFRRSPDPTDPDGDRQALGNELRAETLEEASDIDWRFEQVARFRSFYQSLTPHPSTVSYLHAMLPHVPWRYLPDGRTYGGREVVHERGLVSWEDPRSIQVALQRHLLQTQLTDALLGEFLDRIEEIALDDAIVLVTADHGIAFRAGSPVRRLRSQTAAEVIGVPLFIRYPDQRSGVVDDRTAELVDVVPTIADVLGADLPWDTDGTSLLGEKTRADRTQVAYHGGTFSVGSVLQTLLGMAREREQLFGEGGTDDDLFVTPGWRDLVGQPASSLTPTSTSDASIVLDDPTHFSNVRLSSGFVPALVEGLLTGQVDRSASVAISVNGTIAGAGPVYREGDELRASVFVPPRHFVDGNNDLAFFLVTPERRISSLEIESGLEFTPLLDAQREIRGFELSDGRSVRVDPHGLAGHMLELERERRGSVVTLQGWAVDHEGMRTPEAFVFVEAGRVVDWSPVNRSRPDIVEHFGTRRLQRSGVVARLSLDSIDDVSSLRSFAVFRHAAIEIPIEFRSS